MSNAEQNKALVASFFDILNRNDVPALLDLYAEDGEVTTMGQTLISGTSGKEAIAAAASGAQKDGAHETTIATHLCQSG